MSTNAPNTSKIIPWDELLSAPKLHMRQSIDGIVTGLINTFTHRLEKSDADLKHRDIEIARLRLDLKLREEQLRLARIEKYGPKGEKLSAEQTLLLDLEPGVQAEEVAKEAALPESEKQLDTSAATEASKAKAKGVRYIKAHPGRNTLPAHLERKEVIIPCEEGASGELIGYDEKEELVIKPAEFYVNLIKREKRRIEINGRSTILTAPAPARIVEKGHLSNSIITELLVAKYCLRSSGYAGWLALA